MTIGDIIDEVISQIGGDEDDTELEDKLLIDAKSALRRFPVFGKSGMTKAIASGSLTAGNSTMSKPSGIFKIIGDAYYETNGNRFIIEHVKNEAQFRDLYRGSATGTPQFFQLVANSNTVEFDRKADATRTIYFPAQVSIASVTADTDWAYTDEEAEIFKDGIKYYYYLTEEDGAGESSKNFKADFLGGLKRLEERWMIEEYPDYIKEAD